MASCVICLDVVNNEGWQCSCCKTVFHTECIDKWHDYSITCPMCRFAESGDDVVLMRLRNINFNVDRTIVFIVCCLQFSLNVYMSLVVQILPYSCIIPCLGCCGAAQLNSCLLIMYACGTMSSVCRYIFLLICCRFSPWYLNYMVAFMASFEISVVFRLYSLIEHIYLYEQRVLQGMQFASNQN